MKQTAFFGLIFASLLFAYAACGQTTDEPKSAQPLFLADSYKTVHWYQLARDASDLGHVGSCKNHYEDYSGGSMSVGELIGGKAKSVEVIYVASGDLPNSDNPLPTVEKVWSGRFKTASCIQDWDEGSMWSTEAIVKFEDGTEAKLITDGFHVAFQDHAGRSWFVRLQ